MVTQLSVAVQVVVVVVYIQGILLAIDFKSSTCNTVCTGAYYRTEKLGVYIILRNGIKAQNHVTFLAILIGNDQFHQDCTQVSQHCLHALLIYEGV